MRKLIGALLVASPFALAGVYFYQQGRLLEYLLSFGLSIIIAGIVTTGFILIIND